MNLTKLLNFDDLFVNFFDSMSTYVDAIGRIAAAILGAVVFLYVAGKVWSTIARNEPLDILPLFRPIIIFILCVNFQGIVITPMHYALSPLRTYTNGLVEKLEKNSHSKVDKIIENAQEQRKKAIQDDPDAWGLTKTISIGIENIKEWLISTILDICSFLKSAVYIIMNFIRIFCLVLLAMLGPFAFALSLLPNFENSLTNWFSKYISIYLWAPIFNIINILLGNAELFLAEKVVSIAGSTGMWGLMVLLIVIYIIGAYVFLSTPTFATWIVQGGASSAEFDTLKKGAGGAGMVAAVGGGVAGLTGGFAAKSTIKPATSVTQRGINAAGSLLSGKLGSMWSKLQGK
ncbi:MAG: hypothetical protein LBK47_02520 [Prevotellaceae bacterium]|jgi:hypothetical protein|nr:hypothetical protein [Prevotellaceae bacterium]